LIYYSPAKINLGLQILEKRADGFHEISTLLYPVPFSDIIEINAGQKGDEKFSMTHSGIPVPGDLPTNLCYKAWKLFCVTCEALPVRLHLHKQIPVGAGLGGGSSNAATVLKGLNEMTGNKMGTEDLIELSSRLGSDCSIFVKNEPAMAGGRGEILSASQVDLSDSYLVLVFPNFAVNTAWAYSNCTPEKGRGDLEEILNQSPQEWKERLKNDFEPVISKVYPGVLTIREQLYEAGAYYAAMSGSGSSIYGLFTDQPVLPRNIAGNVIWSGQL